MTAAPRQLVLDLPHRAALGAEDYLVSHSNAAAVELIDRWPNWPHPAAVVIGPRGSGKSHLAHVWQLRTSGELITADRLTDARVGEMKNNTALVIEDLDIGCADEQALFHLLNLARESRISVLMTSHVAPGDLDIALPDLRSRMRALPIVELLAPDDVLLRAVLVKLFSDRQLNIEPAVVEYLGVRMERSMEAANRVVAEVDRLALAKQRKVTRALAAEALSACENAGGTE